MFYEDSFIPYESVDCIARGSALFFAPHPDDEVLGCTAALLSHVTLGDPVRVIVATNGGWGHDCPGDDYMLRRQSESCKAARILGYETPLFWGLRDRELLSEPDLVSRVLEAIDAFSAEVIYAPSWWEVHPDHRALSSAVTLALKHRPLARLVLYEVGVPLQPNRLMDLTPWLSLKQEAVAAFESQLALQAYDRQILGLNAFRAYTLPASARAAEAYRLIEPEEIQDQTLTLPLMLRIR